ncbi:hypothetical protein [Streptomyces sp. NPDC057428]|uniref:hypothetical protein n=1 Tax=Streptomyces sp. NPDC057428 TaxID=3346129 RepID=UPI0036A0C295
MEDFAAGVGGGPVIVILEPDARGVDITGPAGQQDICARLCVATQEQVDVDRLLVTLLPVQLVVARWAPSASICRR